MAHQYQSLNFTHEEVDELLSKCNSYVINGEVRADLEEYKKK